MTLALRFVVRMFGGIRPCSSALGFSERTIWRWFHGLTIIKYENALKIQELTGIPAQYFLVDQGLDEIVFSRETLERLDKLASKK